MPPSDRDSDSDDSDEDYVPEGGAGDSGSEEGSGPGSDCDVGDPESKSAGSAKRKRGKRDSGTNSSPKKSKPGGGGSAPASDSKNVEDEKALTDALWEDFLKDTTPNASCTASETKVESEPISTQSASLKKVEKEMESNPSTSKSLPAVSVSTPTLKGETTVVPGVLSAAVPVRPPRASGSLLSGRGGIPSAIGAGRGLIASGGISRLMAGGKKPSILEQSKRDWGSFKKDEGLEDDLKQHAQSRHSYVEKQQFLTRVDYREFEKEKAVRDINRRRHPK